MNSENWEYDLAQARQASALNRRKFLKITTAAAAAVALPRWTWADAPAGASVAAAPSALAPQLVAFPEKTDLILLTDRPPQLETPLKYFMTDLTPNEAFFVRWHLANIPTSVDASTFRLTVGGHVNSPLSLALEDLKQFEAVSVTAVNQCSGNSRSFFTPRVPGGQWKNGAMGNAKWTGVRVKDLLAKAGVKAGAVQVSFQGLDRAPLPTTPQFLKALDFDRANDGEVIVAYAMNDAPLPMLNGFPLRLIVPGWFATYWIKSLNEITVLDDKLKSFWMDKAYRVPNNPELAETPKNPAKNTVPISVMSVRSLFVSPEPDATAPASPAGVKIMGVAFDGGSGIKQVDISIDSGATWTAADFVGADLGKYSWRRFQYVFKPAGPGKYAIQARATSNAGHVQPAQPLWNHSGYGRNVIETLNLTIV